MKVNLIPGNRLGKWAVGSGVVLVIILVLELIFALAIKGNSAVIEANPLLTILANILSVAFTIAGPLSFITGIIAVVKHREWSVCISLAALYAIAVLLFLSGEFLFPH